MAAATTDGEGPTSELHIDPPAGASEPGQLQVNLGRTSSSRAEHDRSLLTRRNVVQGSVFSGRVWGLSSNPIPESGVLRLVPSRIETAMLSIPCGRPDGRLTWSATARLALDLFGLAGMMLQAGTWTNPTIASRIHDSA
uniref:Uncharacterized protein n=1 Tax=Opuntia streptacantha TaxID=393608 RepID=A0A7C8YKT7_OPUST